MRRQRFVWGIWIACSSFCLAEVAAAQEEAPPQAEEAPEAPEAAPEPSEVTPPPEPRSPREPSGTILQCERVECNCASDPEMVEGDIIFRRSPSSDCVRVDCVCVEPAGQAGAPAAGLEREDERRQRERLRRIEPAPVGGFLISRRDVGLSLELGWPHLQVGLSYGLHDAVELGAGFRSVWGMSATGFLSLRLRLLHNRLRKSALSLSWLGGYTYVGSSNHDQHTAFASGDSVFTDLILAGAIGRGRHTFFINLGFRLGWVQSHQPCTRSEWGDYYDCWDTVFPDGESRVLVTAIFDMGWAMRLRRMWSLFLAFGFQGFVNSESDMPGYGMARFGFAFDIATARREGGS